MHIGFDARLPYYQLGGISQYILHLLPALADIDQQHRYSVFQLAKDGRSRVPSAPNFRRRSVFTPCHHRLERWALGAELLPYRLDVLHSPDFIPPALGARRRIITVHDLNFIFFPQFLTADSLRYYQGQIEWACAVADHISVDSHATRQDLIDRLRVPADKVTTIHLAANPLYAAAYSEATIAATLAKHKLPHGFIFSVGTLEPRKNLPSLIKAYARLRLEVGIDVPLVLAGAKGWKYDEIFATISELELSDCVHHLSGVFDEELAHLYHAAAVLVTPSYYEGFGLPALEAMHCGCPVVVSRRGSLPEIVGPQGWMVDDPEDIDGWVAVLSRVLTDSQLREKMIVTGNAQAQTFSWRHTAVQTLSLYQGDSPAA